MASELPLHEIVLINLIYRAAKYNISYNLKLYQNQISSLAILLENITQIY